MHKKFLTVLFLFLTLTMSAAFAEDKEVFTISAMGEGDVAVAPDMAIAVLSVKTVASDAKTAQEDNAKIANRVISALKSRGIASGDVRTSHFNVYPNYDNNNRKIIGYFAENSISVKIHGVNKVGEIIDGALSSGANQVSSIQFGIADAKNLEKEALIRAIANAREKAEITARALGVSITGVKHAAPSVRRQSFNATPMLMKSAARLDNAATPIESGEVTVHATVNVEFIIK